MDAFNKIDKLALDSAVLYDITKQHGFLDLNMLDVISKVLDKLYDFDPIIYEGFKDIINIEDFSNKLKLKKKERQLLINMFG